ATAPVLVACGVSMGFASTTARRAHRQLEETARLAAATEERDRLARQVHDGVLQVLALVQRRGHEIGGEAEDLARLAAEQEDALRRLISDRVGGVDSGGGVADLTALVRAAVGSTATVSAPADPIETERERARELVAL